MGGKWLKYSQEWTQESEYDLDWQKFKIIHKNDRKQENTCDLLEGDWIKIITTKITCFIQHLLIIALKRKSKHSEKAIALCEKSKRFETFYGFGHISVKLPEAQASHAGLHGPTPGQWAVKKHPTQHSLSENPTWMRS